MNFTVFCSMSQPGSIKIILEASGMEVECNFNKTLAAHVGLGSDPDGTPFKEKWQFSSVVSMLLYRSMHICLDIKFTENACGIAFTPNNDDQLLCYVAWILLVSMGKNHRTNQAAPILAVGTSAATALSYCLSTFLQANPAAPSTETNRLVH